MLHYANCCHLLAVVSMALVPMSPHIVSRTATLSDESIKLLSHSFLQLAVLLLDANEPLNWPQTIHERNYDNGP